MNQPQLHKLSSPWRAASCRVRGIATLRTALPTAQRIAGVVALICLASTAGAQSLDLSWNCPDGARAAQQRNFSCSGPSNETYALHFMFTPPVAVPDFVGLTAVVEIYAPGPLAPFWHFEGGGCQGGGSAGVAVSFQVPASGDCAPLAIADVCDGTGSCDGGVAAYGANFQSLGRGRFEIGLTRHSGMALAAGTRYWAWQLEFTNSNRDNCSGCSDPALIHWQSAWVVSDDGSPPLEIDPGIASSSCVAINGGNLSDCIATPTRATTWGRIKALFR